MLVTDGNHEFKTKITAVKPGECFAVIDAGERAVGYYIVTKLGIGDQDLFGGYPNAVSVANLNTGRIVFKPRTLMVEKLNVKLVTIERK